MPYGPVAPDIVTYSGGASQRITCVTSCCSTALAHDITHTYMMDTGRWKECNNSRRIVQLLEDASHSARNLVI